MVRFFELYENDALSGIHARTDHFQEFQESPGERETTTETPAGEQTGYVGGRIADELILTAESLETALGGSATDSRKWRDPWRPTSAF